MRWAARPGSIIGWTLTAAATYAAVFVLPFRFPLTEPVLSDTWTAGSNNQVAAVAVAVVSVAVALWHWSRSSQTTDAERTGEIPKGYLAAAIAAATLWTAGLGWAVARAHIYWGDEGYFLNQLRTGLVFHKPIYTGFEFAYGPLLYLWPAACIRLLAPLGVGLTAAYLTSLVLMQTAGLTLLFYTVRALPLRRSYQVGAFVLISLGAFNSLLGLNYSLFRFVLPFAAVVLLSRQANVAKAALAAVLGEILCLATSPEVGITFAAATIAYAVYRTVTDDTNWLLVTLASLAGAAVFFGITGPAYFYTLGNMAKGGYNMLLRPAPHILGLLFAAIALAPLAVARYARNPSNGGLIVAFYVAALGMLPAALGRSDAIHVFLDGIGMCLLAIVALDAAPAKWRRLGIVAAALTCAIAIVQNATQFDHRLTMILHPNAVHEDWGFDESALRSVIGTSPVSAPLLAPQRVIDDLVRTGQYVPDYFCGWVGVWDRESEQRKIVDMRRTDFALVAFSDPLQQDPERDRQIRTLMRMGFAGHPPRQEYVRGALLEQELQMHWIARQRFGDYELYQKRK